MACLLPFSVRAERASLAALAAAQGIDAVGGASHAGAASGRDDHPMSPPVCVVRTAEGARRSATARGLHALARAARRAAGAASVSAQVRPEVTPVNVRAARIG